MTKKVLLAIVAIAAVSAYLTIKEEGTDKAFGGAFAPVESVRARDDGGTDPLAGMVTGQSIPTVTQTDYGKLLDRVRSRANAAMDRSVERASR